MGNSPEKRAYAKGRDPDQLSIAYQRRLLHHQQEGVHVVRGAQVLDRHGSKSSLHSGSTSVFLNQMSPEERDAYLLARYKKELAALERRKAFLETIRSALREINAEEESIDSEDENDMFQDEFRKRVGSTLRRSLVKSVKRDVIENAEDRKLLKKNNFRLKQYNRASLKRSKRKDSKDRVSNSRLSRPVVSKLLGEGTREWNNAFGGKLALIRRFYDWDDIPFEFFVDKQVDSTASRRMEPRSLLQARLAEKRALQQIMKDDRLFREKIPRQPNHPPPRNVERINVGEDVVEIDLNSLADSSDGRG